MIGWILYKRCEQELTEADHGVKRFLSSAAALGLKLEVFHPGQFCIIAAEKNQSRLLLHGKPVALPDFVLPRMGAETTFYGLTLLRHLELQGVYSANSSDSIRMVKDKMHVSQLLMANELPLPKTMMLDSPVAFEQVEQEIGFPLVVKNIAGARGAGVYLCDTMQSFRDLAGFFNPDIMRQLIVQSFVSSSYGRDLRVLIVGDEIAGCMQRTAKNSFKANFSLGAEVKAWPLDSEIEHLARTCAKLTQLEIGGIDLLFGDKGYLICEANSSPGFKGMELATGEDIATKILQYIIGRCCSRSR